MADKDLAVEEQETVEGEAPELTEEEQAMADLKEAITVEKEEVGSLRLKLTVTIPEASLEERRSEQFTELKRDALVPGFRKGHAPMELIEKRFGSDVGEQLKSKLISSGYMAAVEKEELKPLGDPLFWVTVQEERVGDDDKPRTVETEKLVPIDTALETLNIPTSGPLTFSCEVELKPEFELPSLEKIPVEQPKVTISDDDVDTEANRMMAIRGTFQPVEKGGVKIDDMLYADMKMSVGDEVIASEENTDIAARDLRLKGVPLMGLGDALKGKKIDDDVTFEAEVPDDHENIDIRGKTAKFDFSIREIKRLHVPPVDSDFLSGFGVESEEQWRTMIRTALEGRLEAVIREGMQGQISQYLIDNTELEIPSGLSQRQRDRAVSRQMIEMYQAGIPEAEIEKQVDELRATAQQRAEQELKLFFVLEKISEDRSVEVSEEQMNGAIAAIAQRTQKRFDRVRDELSKGEGLAVLYHKLRDQQTLDLLLDDAEITEGKGPKTKAKPKTVEKKKTTAAKKSTPKKTSSKKTAKKKTGK